jgi:hypothetical protein
MGRILGLGPGGKCVIYAMAYRHGISPFGDDSGKKRGSVLKVEMDCD